jgi:hypothetical protein
MPFDGPGATAVQVLGHLSTYPPSRRPLMPSPPPAGIGSLRTVGLHYALVQWTLLYTNSWNAGRFYRLAWAGDSLAEHDDCFSEFACSCLMYYLVLPWMQFTNCCPCS